MLRYLYEKNNFLFTLSPAVHNALAAKTNNLTEEKMQKIADQNVRTKLK